MESTISNHSISSEVIFQSLIQIKNTPNEVHKLLYFDQVFVWSGLFIYHVYHDKGHEKVSYSDELRIQSVHWRLISPFFGRYSSQSFASLYVCRLTCRSSNHLISCLSVFCRISSVFKSLHEIYACRVLCCVDWFRFRPNQTYCQVQCCWHLPWSCQILSALQSTRHTLLLSSFVLQLSHPLLWSGLYQLLASVHLSHRCPCPGWLIT